MPQINQLAEVAYSQFFWLLLVLGIIYFGIGRFMLPKIEATVGEREKRISGDLEAAQRAREAADATEEAYRLKTAESRSAALEVTQAAKKKSALEAEARLSSTNAELAAKLAAAESGLRAQTDRALAEIGDVAAEATQDMVAKLSGVSVTRAQAQKAVKAALSHG